jgi:hypothetical protein
MDAAEELAVHGERVVVTNWNLEGVGRYRGVEEPRERERIKINDGRREGAHG